MKVVIFFVQIGKIQEDKLLFFWENKDIINDIYIYINKEKLTQKSGIINNKKLIQILFSSFYYKN